jgi:hypothetical protein
MIRRLLASLACLAVLALVTPVHAAVTSVTVTPATTTATLGGNNQVLLTWHVTSNLNSPIQSVQGQFTTATGTSVQVLGTNGNLLSGVTPPSPANITEALVVPNAVLQAAANQGLATILYTRTFTDDDGPALAGSGSLVINVVVPTLGTATASPSSFSATLQAGGAIHTIWSVTANTAGMGVRSASGDFLLTMDGPVLASVPLPVTGTVVGGTARLTDNVMIPASVVYQALAAHVGVFYFHRHFDPLTGGSGADGWVAIRIVGSNAGPLSLARVSLRFSDGTRRRVVGPEHPLHALATINYTGGGLLQAVWEVATPPGTSGQPVYRPLRIVRQYLMPGGHVLLESPPLPVAIGGRYVVRLRVQSPLLDSPPLALEYSVNPAMHAGANAPRNLPLRQPDGGASFTPATRFAWQPVSGARAYQLEFYAADVLPDLQPPQGGMVVPASTTQLRLSTLARAHLAPGHSYRWRVLAIGADGRLLAVSALRDLRVP